MGLLASLKVMLGVDSVDFQQKMRDSAGSVSLFENEFGKRSTLVQRHGLRLATTADAVASSMSRMKVDAVGAVADIANAAGFAKAGIVILVLKAIFDTLDNTIKAVMRDAMTAGKPLGEMIEGLVADKAGIENVVAQIDLFAKRLGTSAEALGVTNAATKENVAGLLALRDSLAKEALARRNTTEVYKVAVAEAKLVAEKLAEQNKLHAESVAMLDASREAQVRFNIEHGKFIPIGAQVAIALARGQQEMKSFADETRKTLGVMNAEDLRAKAELLEKQAVAIAKSGGSASETVAALGSQFEEVVKVAKELGIQLSPQFEMTAEAIAKGPGLAMDDLFASFKSMPAEVRESAAASGRALDEMGRTLEGKVKGGFVEGTKEGLDSMQEQLARAAATLRLTIPIDFAHPDLETLIQSMIDGDRSKTTRSAR